MKLSICTSYELLGPSQVERWNRLGEEFAKRDTQLLLLTTNVQPGLAVPNVEIPYRLDGFNSMRLEPELVTGVDELLAVEEHWISGFDRERALQGLGKCRAHYRQMLDMLQPDSVFVWNTQLPHGRVLHRLCQEKSIPTMTLERGLLPDTLMLDHGSIHSESELLNSFTLRSVARNYVAQPELVAAYRDYYRTKRPAKYGANDDTSLQKADLRRVKKPVMLVLGQAQGGGVLPRALPQARFNFPRFDSYAQVLERLRECAPEYQLAFRDHPINRWENESNEVFEGVLRPEKGPLHEVIEASDVVVVLGSSTAIYEALVLEKPVIVVGNAQAAAFEAYYACVDGDLKRAIEAAKSGGYAGIAAGAERALSFFLEHLLVGERERVPCKRPLSDIAEFASQFDLDCVTPLSERFALLEQWGATV